MSAQATAQIIPFPIAAEARLSQAPAEPVVSNPESRARDEQQERLTRALASLDAALAEQRIAMSGWRESLDHLRKATTGLGLSMQRYHRTLGKLGTDVSDLHAKSVQLERWADKALTKHD